MNTKEQWEKEFMILCRDFTYFIRDSGIDFPEKYRVKLEHKFKDFIRETREQAYQKGLDDGYSDGFRACEQGVTP